jgi:hypothetical protein
MWRGDSSIDSAANAISTGSSTPTQDEAPVLKSSDFAERPSAGQVTLLFLKDSTGYLACDYWLEAGVLHYVTPAGQSKLLPLGRLDLEGNRETEPATQRRVCASGQ